jgi:polyphosphate kinase 2 (PPK2 family)
MGFCTQQEAEAFLCHAPMFEKMLIGEGIALIKFWFSVTRSGERTRFAIREVDPIRQWKLSETDIALLGKWDDYTAAKITIFCRTHTTEAPWTVVRSNDKKRARLESMRSPLSRFDYDGKHHVVVGDQDPLIVGAPASLNEYDEEDLSPTPLAGTGS